MSENIRDIFFTAIKERKLGNYNSKETSDALRQAFVEANGGSTKLSPKTFYKGSASFALVQEIIPAMIDDGFKKNSSPLYDFVDYRNIAEGDSQEFVIKGDSNFAVASVANGIAKVRRQKLTGGGVVTVNPVPMIARVYDDLSRFLSGKIDINDLVDGVSKAFLEKTDNCIVSAFKGITASTYGLNSDYVKSGSFSEADLLQLIARVEAANPGKKAKIYGTATALRAALGSQIGTSGEVNYDLYNLGYVGKFFSTPVIALPQSFEAGTNTFALPDDAIWVIASDRKFVFVVNGGEGYLHEGDASDNADLTVEYTYIQPIGVGVACADKFGYWYSIV